MNVIEWIGGSLSLRLAITLLHFLWQGLAVAILVVIAGRLLGQAEARLRYGLNVAALLVMAVCLPVTCALIDISWTRIAPAAGGEQAAEQLDEQDLHNQYPLASSNAGRRGLEFEEPRRIERIEIFQSDPESSSVHATDAELEPSADERTIAFQSASAPDGNRPSDGLPLITILGREIPGFHRAMVWLITLAPYLAAAYFLGVLAMVARLSIGLLGGERLRQAAEPVADANLLAMVRRQAARVGLKVAPAMALCEKISVPIVVGVLQPIILLPAALVSGLTPDQLQALILHELAHIRRYDTLVNLLQRVIESLLFFHPAVWLVSRRISRERELAADDLVLAAGWSGPQYADALVRMAELSSSRRAAPRSALVLAASGTPNSEFRCRVLRLLEPADMPRLRLTRGGLVTLVFLAASLLVGPALLAWAFLPQASEPIQRHEATDNAQTPPTVQQVRGAEPEEADKEALDRQRVDTEVADRLDRYGDPLPEGAISRLGTVRFRPAHVSVRGVSIAFVPEQQLLVARGRDGGVGLWDPVNGKMLKELTLSGFGIQDFQLTPDGSHVAILAFEPQPDNREYHTRLVHWDVQTGEVSKELNWREPATEFSQRIAFTPDGKSVAIGTVSGHVRVLDLATGAELLKHQTVQNTVYSITFSEDGEWLAVAGHQEVVLWKWLEGEEAHRLLTHESGGHGAMSLAFSPDGRWLATGRVDRGGIRVWDVATRKLQWQTDMSDIEYTAERIEFSADSRMLVVPAADGGERLELRDAATGRLTRSYETGGVPLSHAAISPDQHWIAGCDHLSILHVWHTADGAPQHEKFVGHRQMVDFVEFTSDGKQLIAAPRQTQIGIWDIESGRQLGQLEHHSHRLAQLAVSTNGRHAAGIVFDNTMRIWNLETGRELFSLPGHGRLGNTSAYVVAFRSDDRSFVSFGRDMYLRIWDIATGKALAEHDLRHDDSSLLRSKDGTLTYPGQLSLFADGPFVSQAAISPNGRRLLTYYSDTLTAFDVATGMEVQRVDVQRVECLRFSPDGSIVAMKERREVNRDGLRFMSVVTLRESDSYKVIREIVPPSGFTFANQIQFTPHGDRFAIPAYQRSLDGGHRYILHLYDSRSGKLQGTWNMSQRPQSFSFSPAGTRLAVSYTDTTILVWDVEQILEDEE